MEDTTRKELRPGAILPVGILQIFTIRGARATANCNFPKLRKPHVARCACSRGPQLSSTTLLVGVCLQAHEPCLRVC